jgi:putative ABC transport system substrate-binding protein
VKRRHLLLAALAAPVGVWGQQPGRQYRVGLGFVQGDELTRRLIGVIHQRLASHGFVEGKNLRIDITTDACCGEHYAREKARAMLGLRPDAVLVFGTVLTRAFQKETSSVPVVFTQVADALAAGIVPNLARPGGNVTGVSTRHSELAVKRLELVRELLPKAKRVALFGYLWDPSFRAAEPSLRKAAAKLGIELVDVDQMSGSWEVPLRQATDAGAAAVLSYLPLVGTGQRFTAEALVAFARERRVALVMSDGEDAALGGLVSYGTDSALIARQGADQLARVLKGERPGEIPVDQIAHFELVVNLKTAKALGVKIPGPVLARADRVIE